MRFAFSSHPEPQNFEVHLLCIIPIFENNCFDFFIIQKQARSKSFLTGYNTSAQTHHSEHNQLGSGQAVVQQRWRVEAADS